MRVKFLFAILCCFALTGCFRVGSYKIETAPPQNLSAKTPATLIPHSAEILLVDGKPVHSSWLDRLSDSLLNILLMYREPQLLLPPGKHDIYGRVSTSSSYTMGDYTYTTTRWIDMSTSAKFEAGTRYYLMGSFYQSTLSVEKEKVEKK